ncbi:MAG: T9SS type A sorting domain-containing protein [Bacteroidetes bacterium]|nr:T9SS type A sorting domain-containing protein [Bacteroidota bacterium]
MKKIYLVLFFLMCFNLKPGFAQNPAYTLEIKNFYLVNSNAITFDMVFTHTDANEWKTAGWQYFFLLNSDFFSGGTVSYQFDSTGGDAVSDLPPAFRPRNPVALPDGNLPGYHELRLASNTLPGFSNGLIIPQGIPTLIGRMKLTSSSPLNLSALDFTIRDSCETPLSVTRTKLTVYNPADSLVREVTVCAGHSVNTALTNPPVAYFKTTYQSIYEGQSISFTDTSTFNPTAWQWLFPGGTPSTSSVQNPAGITYAAPGNYDVTLIASNAFGSDTITKSSYITVNSICTQTWIAKIKAEDSGNEKDSIEFGTSPFATDLLDTCLGEFYIPPPPPTGIFDLRFVLANDEGVNKDIRNDTNINIKWKMNFQPSSSGYPITFTWNNSQFPSTGNFHLKDSLGLIVNVNMKDQNSYVLNSSGISKLYIEYSYYSTKSISVLNGWNIVSVPLDAPDMSVSTIFPGAVSPAYSYNNGYVNSTTLENGKGYWLKFDTARSYSIDGLPVDTQNIHVNYLWNLIGPFDSDIPVSSIISVPSGLISSYFFGFNHGYIIEDTLRSGRGYWIRSNSIGYLKNGSADNTSPKTENVFNKLVTLSFTDMSGKTAELYLSRESGMITNAGLPPVPPSGIFDVRYSSDNFIELIGRDHIINMSSTDRPLKLRVTNLNGTKLKLRDNIDGSIMNMELSENEEITINPSLDNFTVISETTIPDSYELSQNYPNPFNPSTHIKYQIPKDGKVKLIIYNVLGKEILTLVDKFQQAGRYEINFNAVNLSSGIYFYRFESGDFTDLKRMILLK